MTYDPTYCQFTHPQKEGSRVGESEGSFRDQNLVLPLLASAENFDRERGPRLVHESREGAVKSIGSDERAFEKGSGQGRRMRGSAAALFNTKDNEGKTPAHHAAENGHADSLRIVRELSTLLIVPIRRWVLL